jgi:uncharacterized protein (TIGR02147 family)
MRKNRTQLSHPEIFSYHDYRAFLKDVLSYYKAAGLGISLRKLATTMGASPAYLSFVLNGERVLTAHLAEGLTSALKLDKGQTKYFRLLCTVADSSDQSQRIGALNQMQRMRRYRRVNPKETEVYRYLTKWYYVAIREMAAMPGFRLDPKWIQENLSYPVERREISKAIRFLRKYGFIEVAKNGSVRLPEKQLQCLGGIYRVALAQYYRQIFSLSSEAIDLYDRHQRHFFGHTLAIPSRSFAEFQAILDEASGKISKLAKAKAKTKTDSVYYIGFVGLPLARKKEGAQ